ncbi:MAG: cell envelope protein SmpA [Desulfobacterales bacterium]|nr:MAG: cell envelope protein SmpA [Desulfobacterales bacterium]
MKSILYVILAALLLSLPACSSKLSKNISDQGVPEEVVFPDKADAWNEEGTFPVLGNVKSLGPGMSRQAIYQLIGPPHFSERLGAREWDYIFNFRDAEDYSVRQCQYKIIFDDERLAQSFYWLPRDCGEGFFQSEKPADYANSDKQ